MIELRGVGVDVEDFTSGTPTRKTLLDGVDVTLAERRVAVIGANGSGKSTLLRLLNGLVRPTRGRVVVDGHDTLDDVKAVRRRVGFVFTDPLSQLVMPTPLEDVELSLRKRVRGRREREAAAYALLEARGLGAVARQSIYDLSGGERQLVSLTTVLAVEPSVVVCDEPTTLLDLRNRLQVTRALMDLPQQVITATHDLELAASCDRGLVIDDGRLVFDAPAPEAVAHYRELMSA